MLCVQGSFWRKEDMRQLWIRQLLSSNQQETESCWPLLGRHEELQMSRIQNTLGLPVIYIRQYLLRDGMVKLVKWPIGKETQVLKDAVSYLFPLYPVCHVIAKDEQILKHPKPPFNSPNSTFCERTNPWTYISLDTLRSKPENILLEWLVELMNSNKITVEPWLKTTLI